MTLALLIGVVLLGPCQEPKWQPVTAQVVADNTVPSGFVIQKLDVKEVSLVDLLRFLADEVGFNLYVDPSVADTKVTYSFTRIPFEQALAVILENAGLEAEYQTSSLIAVKSLR